MDAQTEVLPPKSYTILRIKRKRNEEPLDALVIESRERRKKSRGGISGVFKFAQTVESDVWDDERRAQSIQDQISRLARESPAISDLPPSSPALPRQTNDAPHYTILSQDDAESDNNRLSRPPRPTNPPKIISSKDVSLKASKSDFKMFDAVLITDKPAPTPTSSDLEMEKFLPMLNDYLKLDDVAATSKPVKEIAPAPTRPSSQSADYVWDIFYHRLATLDEWNQVRNIGTLSGLPPSITDPYDSASESEEEDEADEDSNAEEYYKNDYPEDDETSDSDEFHEDSEYDDMMTYGEDGDDQIVYNTHL